MAQALEKVNISKTEKNEFFCTKKCFFFQISAFGKIQFSQKFCSEQWAAQKFQIINISTNTHTREMKYSAFGVSRLELQFRLREPLDPFCRVLVSFSGTVRAGACRNNSLLP